MAARQDEFERFAELLSGIGPVKVRRMFGGAGIFADGVMFALIAGGELYLKVDGEDEARFRAEDLEPFTFTAKGRSVAMSYRRAPARLYDDPDELTEWARRALAAALRSQTRKPSAVPAKRATRAGKRRSRDGVDR